MNVSIQGVSLTKTSHYRQFRRFHTRPHKQNQVIVPRLSEYGHFHLELFQSGVIFDVQMFDGHVTVPIAPINGPEPTGAHFFEQFQLVERDVPFF